MERTAFIDTAQRWWLLEPEGLDDRIVKSRDKLAENLQWDLRWYAEQRYVEQLYDNLTSNKQRLLDELDSLADVEARVRWIEELVEFTTPRVEPKESADSKPQTPQAEVRADARPPDEAPVAWDEARGMIYRLGADNTYQFAYSEDRQTPRPGTNWMSQSDADASLRAVKPEPAPVEPDSNWDDQWEMLHRVGADGKHEFAHSDDRRTVRQGTQWMSYEEAAAARSGPASDAAEAQAELSVEEVISQAISELSPELSASLAEEFEVSAEDIAKLSEDDRFKEILREVIESSTAAAAATS